MQKGVAGYPAMQGCLLFCAGSRVIGMNSCLPAYKIHSSQWQIAGEDRPPASGRELVETECRRICPE